MPRPRFSWIEPHHVAWLREELGAIVFVLLMGGFMVAVTWYYWASRSGPMKTEYATVIGFANPGGGGEQPLVYVIVRMRDGSEMQLRAGTQHALIHCRRGSRIRLVAREDALFVDPRGCGQASAEVTGAPLP